MSKVNDILNPQIIKGLNDKLYEKRKTAALEIERMIREALIAGDNKRIMSVLEALVEDFAYSIVPNSRNGGLIALAAVAIALGSSEVGKYLEYIVTPIVSCFSDPDSRVRYYACEALYNVSKVARGSVLKYFNPIFDALSKLVTDAEMSVKNGAELLDRLIKDIVSEKSLFSSSKNVSKVSSPSKSTTVNTSDTQNVLFVPGTISIPVSNLTFFNLERFIPLLVERISTLSPATRIFLVNWISVLDSVPDLELVSYLPEFLDGLLKYLSDSNPDVRTATSNTLGEFLKEIKDLVELHGASDTNREFLQELPHQTGPSLIPDEIKSQIIKESYVRGQNVNIDFGRMTSILVTHLSSQDEEIQATSLKWINEFIIMAREKMLPFAPMLTNYILPSLSHTVVNIRNIAVEANSSLFRLVYESTCETASFASSDVLANLSTLNTPAANKESDDTTKLNVKETVNILMQKFQDEHEETRIAALDWILMLHKNVPNEVMNAYHSTINVLLRTLGDHSEEVVKRDLQLLAQISIYSNDEYFTSFMVNLLNLFSHDQRLLETRGSLIIRQLSLSLNPERIYRSFSEILECDEDIEFASIMVQNLNIILITAPELADIRKRLKHLDSKDEIQLFATIYKSWSHNPVALFSLCLLASAYEHAANLLQIFAELEVTVSFLIQLDKLVQLLESPVFTYLRLQLLEPDKYPYLFKCMYGILMLLPQSSAFATLRNRLNSVSSLVMLYSNPNITQVPEKDLPKKFAKNNSTTVSWEGLLEHFRSVQKRHEKDRLNSFRSYSSNLEKSQQKHRSRGSNSKSNSSFTEESEDIRHLSGERRDFTPKARLPKGGNIFSPPEISRTMPKKTSAPSALNRRL